MRRTRGVLSLFLVLVSVATLTATMPPQGGDPWPEVVLNRLRENPRFVTYQEALQGLVRRIQLNRLAVLNASSSGQLASVSLPTSVTGSRSVPVMPLKFSNAARPGTVPFDITRLH